MKYLRTYLKSMLFPFKIFMQHRTDFVLNVSLYMVPLYAKFFLFKTLYSYNITLGEYSLGKLLTYFFASTLLNTSLPFASNYEITDQIVNGKLSLFLVKPISYELFYLFYTTGTLLTDVPLMLLAGVLYLPFVHQNLFMPSASHFFIFLLFLFTGFMIAFYMNLIFNYLSFFFGDVFDAYSFYNLIIWVLSGAFLPLDILPYGKILAYNPFALSLFVPIDILVHERCTKYMVSHILFAALWVFILRQIQKFMFSKGLKRYEASGG